MHGYNPRKRISAARSTLGPKNMLQKFAFVLLICLFLFVLSTSFVYATGYYEISDQGRPPSVFSICCCKKLDENKLQVNFSCNLTEDEVCPEKTKKYPAKAFDCPHNLILTK